MFSVLIDRGLKVKSDLGSPPNRLMFGSSHSSLVSDLLLEYNRLTHKTNACRLRLIEKVTVMYVTYI